jgi:hypothetical protein
MKPGNMFEWTNVAIARNLLGPGELATKEQIDEQCQHEADDDHGGNGDEDVPVFVLNPDIAREFPEPAENSRSVRQDQPEQKQANTDEDENFSKGHRSNPL